MFWKRKHENRNKKFVSNFITIGYWVLILKIIHVFLLTLGPFGLI